MNHKDALNQLLGKKIKKLRNVLKINQEEFANQISTSRSTVSNIESGKHSIPLDVLYKIAEQLRTDVHILLPTEVEVQEKMSEKDQTSQFVSSLELKNISKEDIDSITRNL